MAFSKRAIANPASVNPVTFTNANPADKILDIESQQVMTGMLEQLNLLMVYASELFTNIMKESVATADRISNLHNRAEQLTKYIPSFEATVEATPGSQYLAMPKCFFRSKRSEQNQHLQRSSAPVSIMDIYHTNCIPPPKLDLLDSLRDDGKFGLKEYSNPGFFIDEWIAAQKKQQEEAKAKRAEARQKKGAKKQTEKKTSKTSKFK